MQFRFEGNFVEVVTVGGGKLSDALRFPVLILIRTPYIVTSIGRSLIMELFNLLLLLLWL